MLSCIKIIQHRLRSQMGGSLINTGQILIPYAVIIICFILTYCTDQDFIKQILIGSSAVGNFPVGCLQEQRAVTASSEPFSHEAGMCSFISKGVHQRQMRPDTQIIQEWICRLGLSYIRPHSIIRKPSFDICQTVVDVFFRICQADRLPDLLTRCNIGHTVVQP